MAINRFWNQTQQAEYTPRSMQEIMYAPKIMYDRQEDLTNKVDAMNEANASLKAMLGDKAGKTEEFNAGLKDITDKISREGATQRNIDLAKNLRQSYLKEVLPQEAFAKKRESIIASQMKDRSDQNNIVSGNNAADITFDQYQKDPNSFQYQVAQRDKLIQDGMQAGAQIGEEEDNAGVHVDQYGKLVIPPKFNNSGEFYNAYQNDPAFKQSIDQQAMARAQARGIQNPTPEILNTIISGMATTAAGKVKRENISEYELQRLRSEGLKPSGGVDILSFDNAAIPGAASGSADSPVDKEVAFKANPKLKEEYDKEIARMSKGAFRSQEELNAVKQQLEQEPTQNSSPVQSTEWGGFSYNTTPGADKLRKDRIQYIDNLQQDIDNNFFKASGWTNTTVIDVNNGNKAWIPKETQDAIDRSKKGAVDDIAKFFPTWDSDNVEEYGPATKEDSKFFKEYMKPDADRKPAEWHSLRINGKMTDKGMLGTGQIMPVFHMEYGTGNKHHEKNVSFNFPPDQTMKLLDPLRTTAKMLSPEKTDNANHISHETQLENYVSLYNTYLKAKQDVADEKAKKLKQ